MHLSPHVMNGGVPTQECDRMTSDPPPRSDPELDPALPSRLDCNPAPATSRAVPWGIAS